jgi:hypothetical protein
LPTSGDPSGAAQPLSEITVTASGSYTIGGLCEFNVVYTGSEASAKVAVDVPAQVSRKVPFSYDDQLYLAGCHVVHSVTNVVTREMSPTYGSWEVCFGDRPDEQLTIYYYLDNPETGSAVWQSLTTTVKDGFACAPAIYTGVYAPGGKHLPIAITGGTDSGNVTQTQDDTRGTVRPPSPIVIIPITGTAGTYNIGGVCSAIIEYKVPKLSDKIHVEENTEISANVPFPDNAGILYLPGCHVLHFRAEKLVPEVTPAEGRWEICFASVPNKETTIYFYYANDETVGSVASVWAPLETTIENGMACAPLADYTGVYAPVGK